MFALSFYNSTHAFGKANQLLSTVSITFSLLVFSFAETYCTEYPFCGTAGFTISSIFLNSYVFGEVVLLGKFLKGPF